MRILITGAAGMIGRKLAARLSADGSARRPQDRRARPARHRACRRHVDGGGPRHHPCRRPRRPCGGRAAGRRRSRTWSSISPASSPARRKPISRSATASIWTARGRCSTRSGRRGTGHASSSPRRSPSSGRRFRTVIPDDFQQTPLTSYGTQKLIGELMLADYTRRGFFDGIGIRLPTICVRPGKPNRAASASSPASSASR